MKNIALLASLCLLSCGDSYYQGGIYPRLNRWTVDRVDLTGPCRVEDCQPGTFDKQVLGDPLSCYVVNRNRFLSKENYDLQGYTWLYMGDGKYELHSVDWVPEYKHRTVPDSSFDDDQTKVHCATVTGLANFVELTDGTHLRLWTQGRVSGK